MFGARLSSALGLGPLMLIQFADLQVGWGFFILVFGFDSLSFRVAFVNSKGVTLFLNSLKTR